MILFYREIYDSKEHSDLLLKTYYIGFNKDDLKILCHSVTGFLFLHFKYRLITDKQLLVINFANHQLLKLNMKFVLGFQ